MNCVALRSTPRVGWLTSSTLGCSDSSRATTTFCMLPPESVPTAAYGTADADREALDQALGIGADLA